MRPGLYLISTGLTFNLTQHPGYLPVIPDISTEETTSKLVQQNRVHKTQFDITKACDDAPKQILEAFHNYYVEGIAKENFGFAQTTTLELINHLYN